MRMRAVLVVLALLLAACDTTASPGPAASTKPPDIQQSKIDVVYSGLVADSYYKPTPKQLLTAALDALRAEAQRTGGNADVPTPEFSDDPDQALPQFRLFTAAAQQLAAKNPQLSPSRIGDVAIQAMLNVNPDCHNYYVPARSGIDHALAKPLDAPLAQNRLQYRMLSGNVAYFSWREFDLPVFDDVKKGMDKLLSQGAKTWLFDVRDNRGGEPPQLMVSWFVNGGVIWRDLARDGKTTPTYAKTELYLPPQYQLPIAIVVNRNTFSSAEFFTLGLQARGRAKVFGQRTGGCLGGIMPVVLPDGAHVGIAEQVDIGPTSDKPVNNVGIDPDVVVATGDPVETAAAYLRSLPK